MQQNIVTTLSVSVPLSIDSMELAAKVNAAVKSAFDNLQAIEGVTASLDQEVKKGEGEAAKPVKAKTTTAPRTSKKTPAAGEVKPGTEPAAAAEAPPATEGKGIGEVVQPAPAVSLLDKARQLAGKAA